jgi:hypothetical protein
MVPNTDDGVEGCRMIHVQMRDKYSRDRAKFDLGLGHAL